MEFGNWEVDDIVWDATAEEGEVQESMPMRRAHLAVSRDTAVENLFGAIDGDTAGVDVEPPRAVGPFAEDVLLLVDAANGFNNLSRYGMLWTVRHRCSKLSRFTFNCYRHEIMLICRRPGQEALILLSKEGVTQGQSAGYGLVRTSSPAPGRPPAGEPFHRIAAVVRGRRCHAGTTSGGCGLL